MQKVNKENSQKPKSSYRINEIYIKLMGVLEVL